MSERITLLAQAFARHGKEFYLVGGTVRDELLGRHSHDIDCATNALPEEIKAIATQSTPLHIIPIGERFGTIQVQYATDAEPLIVEVTTYRGERYTPGSRHPDVQFTTSIYEDLRRRDFTINAIAKNPLTGHYVDPWYGRKDLEKRCIRAVDNPVQRFKDDPLRLLRAIRFAAQFDFTLAPTTELAMFDCAYYIQVISQERIRDEIGKLLLQEHVHCGFETLHQTDLLGYILPEVQALRGVAQPPHHSMDVFNHTMTVVCMVPPRLAVRLAALLHDIGKPDTKTVDENGAAHFYEHEDIGAEMTRQVLRRLRFDSDTVEHVANVVKLHMRVNQYTSAWSNGSVRRLFVDAGDCMEDLFDLAIADGASDRNESREAVEVRIKELRERLQRVQTQVREQPLRSPLNGNELMELFDKKPGSWLRPMKEHLLSLVIDGALSPDDKEAAMQAARSFARQR